jgi:hypothetical protein
VTIDAVYLELTVDEGRSWVDMVGYPVTVHDDQWGAYRWTVPERLESADGTSVPVVSTHCRVRVSAYSELAVNDLSDTTFEIAERRSLELLAPNGDERFVPGDTMRVRWQADGIVAVVCSLSLDGGASWVGILDSKGIYHSDTARWGDAAWAVPDSVYDPPADRFVYTASTDCVVKVADFIGCAYGTCYEDRSDASFTIGDR